MINQKIIILNKKRLSINPIKIFLIFTILFLTIFQQMPVVKDIYYDKIRLVLYGFTIALVVISFLSYKMIFRHKFIKIFAGSLIISFLFSSFTKFNAFELLIPFGLIISSTSTRINKSTLGKMVSFYVVLSILLGITSIFYYGNGFTISTQYFLKYKNQIGPIFGASSIILLISIFETEKEIVSFSKTTSIILLGLLLTIILVIRNRASIFAFLATFILLILIYLFKLEKKLSTKKLIYLYGFCFVIILFLPKININPIINFIYDSIFSNFAINDLNSLSAGRTDVYLSSLKFISDNLFFGEIFGNIFQFGNPHNYVLYKLTKFGIVGSLPMLFFYFYLFYFSFINIIFNTSKSKYPLAIYILFFSLIVSLFEYSYPFGPGVSQVMLWFLLGQYIRY